MSSPSHPTFTLTVDGAELTVVDDGTSLLDVLREQAGATSVKDGCSPQGQCGCCTVLVDGDARVSCVTPARRVAGRSITTVDALDAADRWARAFTEVGASQCGFCTPGIIVRLDGLVRDGAGPADRDRVERSLLAHLCRCTGWRTVLDAWERYFALHPDPTAALPAADVQGTAVDLGPGRDRAAAEARAALEGGAPQQVGPEVALGRGGFAADTAPRDALVAVLGPEGWAVAESVAEARRASGKVQGRRTTAETTHPVPVPPGDWDLVLQTSWVEPAYLETDASWCRPGHEPTSALVNGGAFGGKDGGFAETQARALADHFDRPVRVLLSREDGVRLGVKRPPLAAGLRADGTGEVHVVRTPGIVEAITAVLPRVTVTEVDVAGPATSATVRGAGWAEALVLQTALTDLGAPTDLAGSDGRGGAASAPPVTVQAPNGAVATAAIDPDGTVRVTVRCGRALDAVVLRSYCIGAAHMALGWVTSEHLTVDEEGTIHDLTVRSFGVLRAVDTPAIEVEVVPDDGEPVNGSDAVFAAVAAAVWRHQGRPPAWPTGLAVRA